MATLSDVVTHDSDTNSELIPESDVPHAVQRINLHLILQYVGANDWFYMAGVSSLWQQVYKRICEEHAKQQKRWVLKGGKRCSVRPVEAARTHFTKAFASLSRLQLACAVGAELHILKCLPQQAGMYADKQTLLYARAQGLPWGPKLTQSLADGGRLEVLQWAIANQCYWYKKGIVTSALQRADLPMLQWLHSVVNPDLIKECAALGSSATAKLGFVGSVRVLAWLQSAELINVSDRRQRAGLSIAAIAGGHVHTLQWLPGKELSLHRAGVMRFEGDLWAPGQLAAHFGHYDMVKYLYELNTVDVGEIDMRKEAVYSGNLQTLAYLIEQGIDSWCPAHVEFPDQYMPKCLEIAAVQVRGCCLLSLHTHFSPEMCSCTLAHCK
jgi:hypothetical protein